MTTPDAPTTATAVDVNDRVAAAREHLATQPAKFDPMSATEDEAFAAFHEYQSKFGWTGSYFQRGDVDSQAGRTLTDEEWDAVRNSRYWYRAIEERAAENGWDHVEGAVRSVIGDNLPDEPGDYWTEPTPEEEQAISAIQAAKMRFGWAGTYWQRSDAESIAGRELTDDEWGVVSSTYEWRRGLPDRMNERTWDIVDDAINDAGVETVDWEDRP